MEFHGLRGIYGVEFWNGVQYRRENLLVNITTNTISAKSAQQETENVDPNSARVFNARLREAPISLGQSAVCWNVEWA